jgi:hypothetical protein
MGAGVYVPPYDVETAEKSPKNGFRWPLQRKPEAEIWRRPEKSTLRSRFPIHSPIHYGVYLDSFWHFPW